MDDQCLTTAWPSRSEGPIDRVVPLPPGVDPLADPNGPWNWVQSGLPSSGENWPWAWTRGQTQQTIEGYFRDQELLADIELCWPELAWDFANHMLGRSSTDRSEPVQRVDLEATISEYRPPARSPFFGRAPRGLELDGGRGIRSGSHQAQRQRSQITMATCQREGEHGLGLGGRPSNSSSVSSKRPRLPWTSTKRSS